MGTNYYLHIDDNEPIHIGKSSGGWCFSLHVEENSESIPKNFAEWCELFASHGSHIEDEYGDIVSITKMIEVITDRRYDGDMSKLDKALFKCNHAVPGPNGLLRHVIDDFCIGWGNGTYDYVIGEFC